MFIRPPLPQPLANSEAKVALLLRSGSGPRVIEIGGRMITALIILACLLIAWFVLAATYIGFRDEAVRALAFSERRSVQAYEDRIAELRTRIDRLTARQVANQDTIEDRVASLVARQAELEARQVMVAEVSQRARDGGFTPGGLMTFEAQDRGSATLPSAFRQQPQRPTPLDGIPALPFVAESGKPAPTPPARNFEELKMRGAMPGVVDEIEQRTERMERSQIDFLRRISQQAEAQAQRDRRVLGAIGLPMARFGIRDVAAAPQTPQPILQFALRDVTEPDAAMGGPLFPPRQPTLAEAFENGLSAAEQQMSLAVGLRRVTRQLPLARPLGAQFDITSGFGTRVDPFTRGYAMHSGIDFRAPTGTHVRVTAPGRVAEAGTSGGYGRMVEVDHGNGISTRYAHLSVILVKEGDAVAAGAVIGQVGSTGRSTGPHLHYEVRIDEDAADPMRFLRAVRGG
jgi:murein DD-endopeptidase MepM/ murein hydrolase activator NlpD